jgi:F-type H+-transporting ATPase subunit delta
MRHTRASIRYAKAVLNLALELKKADRVNEDMLLISSTIEENKELQILLSSPIFKTKVKRETLSDIFEKKINEISLGLIYQLIENKRLAILQEVAKQYTIIYDFHKGTQIAKVTTATPITADLREKVLAKVTKITGKKIKLENIIDPSIIGGFILRVGDKQYDSSISGKFNNLRREFDDDLYVPKI